MQPEQSNSLDKKDFSLTHTGFTHTDDSSQHAPVD